jgi:putative ABC transport system substrate-binding protein
MTGHNVSGMVILDEYKRGGREHVSSYWTPRVHGRGWRSHRVAANLCSGRAATHGGDCVLLWAAKKFAVAIGKFLENVGKSLAEFGYVEGKNYRFELRDAGTNNDLIPVLMRELVDQEVSLIITTTTVQLEAAKAATQSVGVPVVFEVGVDPVENGFVASLNKPGGNLTGIYDVHAMLAGKRLEILHELVPSATKFAFLSDPGNLTLFKFQMRSLQAAADSLGLNLLQVKAHTSDEFEAAFEASIGAGAGGMVVGTDTFLQGSFKELIALADRYRLPAVYVNHNAVKAGGLVFYGTDEFARDQMLGNYAGRVLRGEKPADMPVQQTTNMRLTINLKTAAALGITVPNSLIGRADEVIE